MPPKYVKNIRDEIFYEYSKMISKRVYGEFNHGFIGNSVKDFRSGKKTMSGTIREWEAESSSTKECAFCGAVDGLEMDHVIPKSLGGPDDSNNLVWSCGSCNSSRGNKTMGVSA
ncbi:MAG: HNH endonuclease [Desulfomonilaceae bacterium]